MTVTQHLESSRLFLRPIVDDDFAPFYARLACDPVVMTFFHAYTRPMPDAERRARARRDFLITSPMAPRGSATFAGL